MCVLFVCVFTPPCAFIEMGSSPFFFSSFPTVCLVTVLTYSNFSH